MSSEAVAAIERLLEEAEQLPDPRARALARSLAAALVDLIGSGLSRAIELGGPDLLRKLADDELVGNLLVLAGTHPDSPTVRARRALEAAASELHSCGVTLVMVEDGPRVMLAAERGTPVDDDRVRAMIEAIVLSHAPDVETVRIEIAGRAIGPRDFVPVERLYAATRKAPDHERCELCATPIAADHEHLYSPANRTMRCACPGCALIIPTSSYSGYRRIPRGTRRVEIADVAGWLDRLAVPVGIAALIRRDGDRTVVGYPGAAGLVEAAVEPAIWDQLVRELPLAATLEPEVEALVWSRLGGDRVLRVGIDVVYRLIGELRQQWEGITGGAAVVGTVERILSELHAEAA